LGAFRSAVATGAPVIPVSLAGTRRFLRDRTILPRPTHVTITLSAPLYPERIAHGDAKQLQAVVRLRDQAREMIAKYSGEPLV
jgi:1-acyl-sn-glycerol-3-phosphate acyltransferase